MGWEIWIIIGLLIAGFFYVQSNPEIIKQNGITNIFRKDNQTTIKPIDNFFVKNETPSSTITVIQDKTYFSRPWQYYDCSTNEDCRTIYGVATFCQLDKNDTKYGSCYANK